MSAGSTEQRRGAGSASRPGAEWTTWLAVAVLLLAVVVALLGPAVAPEPPERTVGRPFDPEGANWLGTEVLGRDVWSRILHGGRRLVVVPALVTLAATIVGTTVGLVTAAYRTAGAVLRVVDILAIIPPLVVVLVAVYRFGGSLFVLGAAIVATSTPFVARYIRAVATPVLASDFVLQARLLGEPRPVILGRHVLPNLIGPILADVALRLPGTFYLIAAAGFLGLGTTTTPDWAAMINQNLPGVKLNVAAVAAPALAIGAVTVPLNVLSDRIAARWA